MCLLKIMDKRIVERKDRDWSGSVPTGRRVCLCDNVGPSDVGMLLFVLLMICQRR